MKKIKMLKRRKFLAMSVITTGMSILLISGYSKNVNSSRLVNLINKRNFKVKGKTSLRLRANSKNLLFGSAVQASQIHQDLQFAKTLSRECNIIVPEIELKWHILRPFPGIFNFEPADKLLAFAQAHRMQMRGHPLVWHDCLPSWLENSLNTLNAREILEDHISTTLRHFSGKIHSWDVVNEAIEPNDGRSDGLRDSLWLRVLGENYIDLAFRFAAKADPSSLLTYNDYGLDYDTPFGHKKRKLVLNLLKSLKSKNTPIHALGIQAHLCRDKPEFNPDIFRQFLQDVADLGLKILITELDVTDRKLPTDLKDRDLIIAAAYEDYLSIALSQPAVIGVLTWGLSDRYTWISTIYPRKDGTPVRPLPLDQKLTRKLAWNAIARCLDNVSVPSFSPHF